MDFSFISPVTIGTFRLTKIEKTIKLHEKLKLLQVYLINIENKKSKIKNDPFGTNLVNTRAEIFEYTK